MSELADKIVETLNHALRLDPLAVKTLVYERIEALPKLFEHPTLPFVLFNGNRLATISTLSVLNSLLDKNREVVVLDKVNDQLTFRVIDALAEPEIFAQCFKLEGRATELLQHLVPTHRQLAVLHQYTLGEDGKYSVKQTIGEMPEDDPAYQQAKVLAKANPERVAFGFSFKEPGKETQTFVDLLPEEVKNPRGKQAPSS